VLTVFLALNLLIFTKLAKTKETAFFGVVKE